MAVRRVDRAVDRVGEPLDPRGRHRPVREERQRRGPRGRARNGPLLETSFDWGDGRKEQPAHSRGCPPLDHSVALKSWPMLLVSRSWKIP